jgi:dTDP-4-amino-4,6-dideoxygalactose transaminase
VTRAPIPIAKPFLGPEEEAAAAAVLRSGWLMQGSRVAAFEEAFAAHVGAPEAIAVSSCTAALHLTLHALGVGPGDEVICPSLSFIATANAVVHAGATPRFADVDEQTLNLTAETVAPLFGPRTRALLVVHQVGLPAELHPLLRLCERHQLPLVEDAACAVAARYHGAAIGRPHGVAACFSFHPRKILTTGEGGMITTADTALAARLRRLRQHAMAGGAFQHGEAFTEVGWNYRLTDLQAAVGLVQLGRLGALAARRREQAARYRQALAGLPGLSLPAEPPGCEHGWQSYVVRLHGAGAAGRDRVLAGLLERGVGARVGVMAAHRQPAYAAARAHLPVTDLLADETLALPLYHELAPSDQDHVVATLAELLAG